MTSRLHAWRFWLITLAAVAGIAVTQSLGFWQLSRAAQKEALQAAMDARRAMPALDNAAVAALPQAGGELHRPVHLQGEWLAQHTVFLDNRQMHGRPGFYVLTPLRLQDAAGVVLVQRGWVPRNFVDRERLPPVETPPGPVELAGRVAAAPSRLLDLHGGGAGAAVGSSAIRQNLDLAAFSTETRLALLPFTVVQTGAASQGLQRDWPEVAADTGKHYGYAFQWFGLSGLLAILYVWFQFIAPWRKARGS
jgi:surfeit locus 1 family protein